MAGKPNFLILMVDQLSGVFFPDGPADFLKTPNLRALSQEAVNFRRAYCASPLCAPSRVSFHRFYSYTHTSIRMRGARRWLYC